MFCKASNEVALHGGEEREKYCCKLQRNENLMAVLANSFKEDCGSRWAVLQMMMMINIGTEVRIGKAKTKENFV
jgi:hypothetical protein